MLPYGNSPMAEQVPPDWRDKIVHANFAMGVTVLAGADVLPERYVKPQGFYVLLGVDDPLDAERIFSALAENGEVHMAIQKTFWSARFGVLTDQFGIPWEINCEQAPAALV
jgi:PhnB protein